MIGVVKEGIVANVYAEPNVDSMIICQIAGGNRVEVDLRQDIGKFCQIYTSMGVEGFCMRKYIIVER